MAITFVKNGGVASAKGVSVTSFTITVPAGGHAAGNLLVVVAGNSTNGSPPQLASASDARGNSYAPIELGNTSSPTLRATILASVLTTALQAGDLITVSFAGGIGVVQAYAAVTSEFSGVTVTEDVASTFAIATSTAMSVGPITPPSAVTLVLGAAYWQDPTTDFTTEDSDTAGGVAWTNAATTGTSGGSASSNRSVHFAYKITASSAAQTYNWTLASSVAWGASIAALQQAAPAAPPKGKVIHSPSQAVLRAALR